MSYPLTLAGSHFLPAHELHAGAVDPQPAALSTTMSALTKQPNHMSPKKFQQASHRAVNWMASYTARLDESPVEPGCNRAMLPPAKQPGAY